MDHNVNGLQRTWRSNFSAQGQYPTFVDESKNKGSFDIYANGSVTPTADYTKFQTNRRRRRA